MHTCLHNSIAKNTQSHHTSTPCIQPISLCIVAPALLPEVMLTALQQLHVHKQPHSARTPKWQVPAPQLAASTSISTPHPCIDIYQHKHWQQPYATATCKARYNQIDQLGARSMCRQASPTLLLTALRLLAGAVDADAAAVVAACTLATGSAGACSATC